MEHDERVGHDTESARGSEGRETERTPKRISDGRRTYAVANVTHANITFLCAENAVAAHNRCRIGAKDVIWHTTRIREGKTHVHHEDGTCVPKTYALNKAGKYLAR
jgi:hypothetical protein